MQLEFSYADGMVRIQDVTIPRTSGQLDFSAPPGAFYTSLATAVPADVAKDVMTLWHVHRPLAIASFTAAECSVPAGPDFATLKPLIDAILSQSTPTPSGTMTPVGTIYVSAVHGTPAGNGSLSDPIDTITTGIDLAHLNAQSDGIEWSVYVLTGTYDEQIAVPPTATSVSITLGVNAQVIFSGAPAVTVDATNGDVYITMEDGSILSNTGGSSVLYPDINTISVVGVGTIRVDGPYQALDLASFGTINLTGIKLLNSDPLNTVQVIDQADGTLNMVNVSCVSVVANTPIIKSGGVMNLTGYRNYSPAATNYAESPSPQDIQIAGCFSNVNKGPQISETVEPMNHNASFVI